MKTIVQFHSITTFATQRLQFKKLKNSDLEKNVLMDTNQEVMATLGGLRAEHQTQDGINYNIKHWEEHGFGAWMCYLLPTEEWVGRCALRRMVVGGNEEVEVVYAIMPNFWGEGYATEMARACVEIAFDKLNLDEIVCFALTENKASQRVMEKVGFKYERDFTHANLPHVLYRMKNPHKK